MKTEPTSLTIGDIARRYDLPKWRVGYAIAKNEITEVGRAGIVRLFTPQQADEIANLVKKLRQNRTNA